MRLRDLFMILLLCMTVGVLGTSCTGDDGEAGPPGPPGPAGPPGEPTEAASVEEPTLHYAFLSNWGYPDGLNCDDLETTAPFPGPAELDPYLADDDVTPMIASFEAQCDGNTDPLLVNMDAGDATTPGFAAGYLGLGFAEAEANDAQDAELVFIKTMVGEESNLGDPVFVPETDRSPPSEIETETKFAGGPFIAEFADEGSGEGLQRLLLYSECNKGTAPPDLKGEWRGVLKTETIQAINAETKLPVVDIAGTLRPVIRTTTKICIRLDAMPNAVKCFIDVKDVDGTTTQQIAIYKDGKPMTVGKVVSALTNYDSSSELPAGAVQDFFSVGADKSIFTVEGATAAASDTAPAVINGADQVGKLCNLIDGAEK